MHSLHCKRHPQPCYFSLIFYAVSDSTNKYLNHCTAQNRSKIGEVAESATVFAEFRTVCGIQKQMIKHLCR